MKPWFVSENQRAEVLLTDYARQLTTGGGKPGQGYPLVFFESAPSSRASAASTSASNGPVCASCGNAKPTPTDVVCCEPTGPTSPAGRTCEMSEPQTFDWQADGGNDKSWGGKARSWIHDKPGTARTLSACKTLAVFVPSTSSAEGFPARTCPSPADAPGSKAPDQASSSSSPESLTLFGPAGSSSRMFPDFFPPTVDEISPSYTRRWPTSGMGWPGESWTADTSESPKEGVVCSLSDILEPTVPARFFLSSRAARGILRRAERRGKRLPEHLAAALEIVAGATTPTGPPS